MTDLSRCGGITEAVRIAALASAAGLQLCSASYELGADGTVLPLEGAGLGVEVDEDFIRAHPLTDGPAWHRNDS